MVIGSISVAHITWPTATSLPASPTRVVDPVQRYVPLLLNE